MMSDFQRFEAQHDRNLLCQRSGLTFNASERVYERDHYNRGWKKNFCEVMGQGLCEWVCPVAPTRLTAEQEPLIVTVTEQTSATWSVCVAFIC